MKKSILVILAHGFEEMEAIVPIDILRRADIEVTVASLESDLHVRGKNNIVVTAEVAFDDVLKKSFDAILLPGGPGARKLRGDSRLLGLVKQFYKEGKIIGAICIAPTILKEAGILEGKHYTAHFSGQDELLDIDRELPVVRDGNIITSQGPGTTILFAFALVEALTNKSVVEKLSKDICYF